MGALEGWERPSHPALATCWWLVGAPLVKEDSAGLPGRQADLAAQQRLDLELAFSSCMVPCDRCNQISSPCCPELSAKQKKLLELARCMLRPAPTPCFKESYGLRGYRQQRNRDEGRGSLPLSTSSLAARPSHALCQLLFCSHFFFLLNLMKAGNFLQLL